VGVFGDPCRAVFSRLFFYAFWRIGFSKMVDEKFRAAGEDRKVFEREQGVTSMLQSARDRDNAAIPSAGAFALPGRNPTLGSLLGLG
jgi:hypothetical protein